MPIINGKKRYIPEAEAGGATEKKRYQPQPKGSGTPAPVKRYVKAQSPPASSSVNTEAAKDFIGSYEFDVQLDTVQVNFSRITNMGSEIETEVFVEGGNNDYPIIRKKPSRSPDIIIFEKGMPRTSKGSIFEILREGMKLTNILIFVKKAGSIVKIYGIDEGLILSRKFTDLDAGSSSIFIEKLELAHTGISEIDPP
ncbi:MAG: hypothetical protein QM657_08710 [Lacrimispora sp.]|uniref:phage tail protein n=1 Tax=Lacrimispora sp. TaxID=2719234 RepID=UPI0039E616C2